LSLHALSITILDYDLEDTNDFRLPPKSTQFLHWSWPTPPQNLIKIRW